MQQIDYLLSLNNQIKECIKNWEKWLLPAINDVQSKYKRTLLGPIWNILATVITLSIMAFVWSFVFNVDLESFIPYIFNGFIVFFLFNNNVVASCQLLTNLYKDIYLNIPASLLSLILRNFAQNILSFTFYFMIIFPMYFIMFDFKFINIIFYFLGLILFSLNTILISYICCMVTTRYRDFQPLIQSILSAATLLTPIIWNKEMLGDKMNYVYLNPLTFMIEIVRDPVIGKIPELNVYLYNILLFLFLYIILFIFIKFKGNRIIYWI